MSIYSDIFIIYMISCKVTTDWEILVIRKKQSSSGKSLESKSNPNSAELFVRIFHSFETKIANTISSFKWMNNNVIDEQ